MLTKKLRPKLERIRNVAILEAACFSRIEDDYPIILKNDEEVDQFIKQRIRLWFYSWIVAPLNEILEDK